MSNNPTDAIIGLQNAEHVLRDLMHRARRDADFVIVFCGNYSEQPPGPGDATSPVECHTAVMWQGRIPTIQWLKDNLPGMLESAYEARKT